MSSGGLQNLLHRIAVMRIIEAFDDAIAKADITHKVLSEEAGMSAGAFSGTKSDMEDLRLSSFLRYWCSALRILQRNEAELINIIPILKSGIEIIDLSYHIGSDLRLEDYSKESMELYNYLRSDVLLLRKKGKVTEEGLTAYFDLYKQFEQALLLEGAESNE